MWSELTFHLLVTLREMLSGALFALSLALPLALLMARYRAIRTFLQPLFLILKCLPMFVLAPLMVVWFGWSFWAIVVPITLMLIFPVTIGLFKGITAVPRGHLDYFRAHQATRWQLFWKLRLPFALPSLFSSLRIAAAMLGTAAVAGEWAGGQEGLGIYIQECRYQFDIAGVFWGVVLLLLLTLACYGFVVLVEWSCLRAWRRHALG